eukprot:Gb_31181 [translate_table: standard]
MAMTRGVSSPLIAARPSCVYAFASSSPSPLLSNKGKYCFPKCKGLKISVFATTFSVASTQKRREGHLRGVICEAQETVTQALEVNDSSWQQLVLDSDIPVLVDFWAPWCGPCRMIAPLIDELARQYAGKIVCFKLNTDESPRIATEYGIRSIPTVMFFKNGEKKDTVIGAVPKTTLITTIEKYLDR